MTITLRISEDDSYNSNSNSNNSSMILLRLLPMPKTCEDKALLLRVRYYCVVCWRVVLLLVPHLLRPAQKSFVQVASLLLSAS